jgi:hypothetical protein
MLLVLLLILLLPCDLLLRGCAPVAQVLDRR